MFSCFQIPNLLASERSDLQIVLENPRHGNFIPGERIVGEVVLINPKAKELKSKHTNINTFWTALNKMGPLTIKCLPVQVFES